MEGHDHHGVTAGHEGHEVHHCHRCGWPFPNPHPSAKHRRAHKKVCGKVEGYKTILSEEHDHHLAVSDDDQASDDEHKPSPKVVKKDVERFGSIGGIGEISNRSEDDVFADAVTEFSDSGVSPLSVERSGSGLGLNKEEEQKILESDFHGKESSTVNKTGDKIEPYSDPTSNKETINPGTLVMDANNQPRTVLPVTDSMVEAVSVESGSSSQNYVTKPEIPRDGVEDAQDGLKKCDGPNGEGIQYGEKKEDGRDLHILEEEQKLTSVNAGSKEGIISDPAVIVVEKDPRGTLVSEVAEPDLLPQTETLPNKDASAVVESAAVPEASGDNATASIGLVKASVSTEDVKVVGVADNFQPEESIPSGPSVKPAESSLHQDASKDAVATVYVKEAIKQKSSFTDAETVENSGLGDMGIACNNISKGDKCDADGNENDNQESEHKASLETASKAVSADSTCVPEDESCKEVPKREEIETVGGSSEVKVILGSPVFTDQSNRADGSAGNVEELSKPKSDVVKSDVDKSIQEQNNDKLNEELRSITSEYPASQVISEVPDNVKEPCDVGLESAQVAETVKQLKDPKESTFSDPEMSNESFAKENKSIGTDVSESDDAKGSSELSHDVNVAVVAQNSEHLPAKKYSNEISPDSEERCTSEDISTSKPSSFVLNAELVSESNGTTPEKCSETPSLKEVVPPSLPSQELHETSITGAVGPATAKLSQDEFEDKLSQPRDVEMAVNPSGNSGAKSESLDGTVSDSLETSSAHHKTTPREAHNKSDDFEPPSFMTLVQSSGNSDQVSAPSEIEAVQNNQQPKPEDLQPGWFPSITNVVNESEGRKRNEEMIAKVTNSNPAKHHSPLKNLLSEAKTPDAVQPPAANPKDETKPVANNGTSAAKDAVPKDPDTQKHVDGWSSPARYPIETKKEKKKSKSPWVPFLCCSSRNV